MNSDQPNQQQSKIEDNDKSYLAVFSEKILEVQKAFQQHIAEATEIEQQFVMI